MIISANNIQKTYIDNHVLKNITFHLNANDKAALIGINGCGKTTLLKIIMQLEKADNGEIVCAKDTSIGYLPQNALIESDNSIYDELLNVKNDLVLMEQELESIQNSMTTLTGEDLDNAIHAHTETLAKFENAGGYLYKSEIKGILMGLGFDENMFSQKINTLSGGQKTRVALGKILINSPDIIILDEPTNHLDMNSINWLENYLLNYKKTFLIVSHDRYFLDKIVNKVVEIENGVSTTYEGNYSDYAVKKEIIRNMAMKAYLKQQSQIQHQEQVIEKLRSFNREKSIKRAESRVKALDKIERIDKPVDTDDEMRLSLIPRTLSGKDVLSVNNLSKAYGNNLLFSDLSFEIKRGEHVSIIGDNGTGKTTLLKILNQLEHADAGQFKLGSNVSIGYYDQEHHVLDDNNTIFEEISNEYPSLNNTEIRNVLAAFLFTGEDVMKQIGSLSGGEKGRVSLAKLMLSEANFLILDEPTNHLDITSKEILENALNSYEGTLLYVSHDRYFINQTADKILELKKKTFTEYYGNYDYYLEKKDVLQLQDDIIENKKDETNKLDWKAQKEHQATIRKIQNRLNDVEAQIEVNENKQAELNEMLNDPANSYNSSKLNEISSELAKVEDILIELMEQWEEISKELEEKSSSI